MQRQNGYLVFALRKEVAMSRESSPAMLAGCWSRMRSHKRMFTKVNLVVEWTENHKHHSMNGFTMDVSYSGCLAVVASDLKVSQVVRLVNCQSGSAADARVVWRGAQSWDVGLELLKPDAAFWNL